MNPQRYRKKPVTIEAVQLTETNLNEVALWCGGRANEDAKPSDHTDVRRWLDIPTLEGVMKGELGDWIIRGVQGEFYPVKDSIFRETYEAVDES